MIEKLHSNKRNLERKEMVFKFSAHAEQTRKKQLEQP